MTAQAKIGLTVVTLVVLVAAPLSMLAAREKAPADAAFERLKALAGTWETIEVGGDRPSVATYTVTGGGKAVIEMMGGMATAYHLDKGTLVMTHYCGAGNQPRMKAKSIANDGRQIAFEMYDITNHPDPDSYYSSGLDVRFLDEGVVELAYRGMTAGRGSTQTFRLVKRRSSTAAR